jgi:hypothetical protein
MLSEAMWSQFMDSRIPLLFCCLKVWFLLRPYTLRSLLL